MSKDNNKVNDLSRQIIENIALDFIVNETPKKEIMDKYNLSELSMRTIIERLSLIKKRDKYREKVLEKSLDRCSTYQSKIIFKTTEILHNHVEALSQKAREQAGASLSSSEIRDVMAILQIISKEHRLDNDKPTDHTIKEVQVRFPEGFIPITQKHKTIEAEVVEVTEVSEPEPDEEAEVKVEEIEVEVDDDILGSPLG